jgi:hypothetical protein
VVAGLNLRDVRTYRSDDPCDLVAEHARSRNDVVRSEKQISVTQPRRSHFDEDFAPNRRGNVHVLELESATEFINYKRLHLHECNLIKGSLMRPRHLYYQTDRDKVSVWNCGI